MTGSSSCSLDPLVRRLLTSAWKANRKARELEDQLAPLLLARYGIDPSGVDCEEYIEGITYGHGGCSLKELDEAMTRRGYPPNAEVRDGR